MAAHGHGHDDGAVDAQTLPEERGKHLLTIGGALAAVGILLAIAGMVTDRNRFAPAYLVGFAFTYTIGLGGLFWVILHHLTKAQWSVAARRQLEWISTVLPVCLVLFVPILLMGHTLYHHWMEPAPEHAAVIAKKKGWLNPTFFWVRAGVYLVIWSALAWFFFSHSRKQDASGDKRLTLRMQTVSAPAILLFALSLTFAAFDWLMSLAPTWYSTIFGVYIFAGSVTSGLSVLALLTIALQKWGYFKKVSTIEHRHDIGKLLFAFIVFYAYITYSQFMLIWYANLPEETFFFAMRWVGGWKALSVLLILGHFVFPFLLLLSRNAKRNMKLLAFAAVWMLFMHWVDMYWLVMPNFHADVSFSWLDLAGFLGPVGVLALVLAWQASRSPLYPLKDPRLAETMRNVNL